MLRAPLFSTIFMLLPAAAGLISVAPELADGPGTGHIQTSFAAAQPATPESRQAHDDRIRTGSAWRRLPLVVPAALHPLELDAEPYDRFAPLDATPAPGPAHAGPADHEDALAGLDRCLPADARCRAFVAGDGPKKGRFAGRLPDGTEVEISRFQAWRQLRCLAYAAWAEARSEGTEGMLAVMQLILHRVGHDEHPDTVCGVVSEPRQFDAMLSKKSRRWLKAARDRDAMVPAMPKKLTGPDAEAAEAALTLAWRLMTGQIETDLVGGATFYATVELIEQRGSDVLAPNLEETTVVGEHAFFRLVDEDDEDGASTLVAHR